MENNNLYNDKELFEDGDLDWYDYGFRNYDAQIGRFPQLDPLTDDYPELTNYQYASNDPIDNIDVDGLEGSLATVTVTSYVKQSAKVGANIGIGALAGIASLASNTINAFKNLPNNISNIGSNIKQSVTNVANKIDNNIKQKADNEGTSYWMAAVKGGLDGPAYQFVDFDEPFSIANITPMGRGKGLITTFTRNLSKGGKVAKTGSTAANQLGQDLHKLYKAHLHDPSTKMYKEYTGLLKKYGIKPDFVDFNTRTIYDLKPNNPKKMRAYTKQLENYKAIFEKEFGGTWNTIMDKY